MEIELQSKLHAESLTECKFTKIHLNNLPISKKNIGLAKIPIPGEMFEDLPSRETDGVLGR